MKTQIIILSLIVLCVSTNVHAIFGINALKDSVNKELSDIKAELGVIKDNQIEIKANTQANAKVRASGYDRSQNTDTTAGRDVSIINDPGFLKTVIGALAGTNAASLTLVGLVVVISFRTRKEKKTFKQRYYKLRKKIKANGK